MSMYSEALEHESHPEHSLKLRLQEGPYWCNGCGQVGFGDCYACACGCSFYLHKVCAVPDPDITHPAFPGRDFRFLPRRSERCYCDACGLDVCGYVYRSSEVGHPSKTRHLHPNCTKIPKVLDRDHFGSDSELVLKLKTKKKLSDKCNWCEHTRLMKWGKKRNCWAYAADCGKFHFHVACVLDLLRAIWEETHSAEKKAKAVVVVVNRAKAAAAVGPRREEDKKGKAAVVVKPNDGASAKAALGGQRGEDKKGEGAAVVKRNDKTAVGGRREEDRKGKAAAAVVKPNDAVRGEDKKRKASAVVKPNDGAPVKAAVREEDKKSKAAAVVVKPNDGAPAKAAVEGDRKGKAVMKLNGAQAAAAARWREEVLVLTRTDRKTTSWSCKLKTLLKIAKVLLPVIISAVLGDPTMFVTGLVCSLISQAFN